MIITNKHKDPLGLPTGQALEPNTQTPVSNWDEIKKNAVVAAWLRAGLLEETGGAGDGDGSKFVQPDKAELQAKLDALGVQYDKRAGVAKLQALLAEAEQAQQDHEAAVDAARAASGLDAEAWDALPEDERAALVAAEVEKHKAAQA